MSDLSMIRAAIVATLKTVPGIGRVHGFERFAQQEKAFRELYQAGDRVLGWNVRRQATRESSEAIGLNAVTHEWKIRGFMSISDADASELAFDALIEAARTVFRTDETLGGTVASTVLEHGMAGASQGHAGAVAGLQLVESGPLMFCGVLCHSAHLELFTRHYT